MIRLAMLLSLFVTIVSCDDGADAPETDAALAADAATTVDAALADAASTPDGDPGTDAATVVDYYDVQWISDACGPADGPALWLSLGETTVLDSCLAGGVGDRRINLWVWDVEVLEVGGTVQLDGVEGDGELCPGGDDPCEEATGGSITFDGLEEDVDASGSWTMTTASGTWQGSFDTSWCEWPGPLPCG